MSEWITAHLLHILVGGTFLMLTVGPVLPVILDLFGKPFDYEKEQDRG